MRGIHFLTKSLPFESGVIVSLHHMERILKAENIPFELSYYTDDNELLTIVSNSPYDIIDIHVPSFMDETFQKLVNSDKIIVVSIHSTMCNLQVEEGCLDRLMTLGDGTYSNLYFTCPSYVEVIGFNAVMKNKYLYLPNTFSRKLDNEAIEKSMLSRRDSLEDCVKVSLISAYRPLKNMVTQMAAIAMLSKTRKVELHLVDSSMKTPIYNNILQIAKDNDIPVVLYPSMTNDELLVALRGVHIGMQVSLSETFSYVAMEHMIQGVPMVGSDSVPYATVNASYADVTSIYESMKSLIESPEAYYNFELQSIKKAESVAMKNNQDALNTICELITKSPK